jgi:hypothetical protein
MSARAAAWLAWSLCALCVALAVASPILGLLNGRTLGEIFTAWSGPSEASRDTPSGFAQEKSVSYQRLRFHEKECPICCVQRLPAV